MLGGNRDVDRGVREALGGEGIEMRQEMPLSITEHGFPPGCEGSIARRSQFITALGQM